MARRFVWVLIAGLFAGGFVRSASAEQTTTPEGKVVHTRLAPVAVHRVFPPYTGIHVYARGPRGRAASANEGESSLGGIDHVVRDEVIVHQGPVYSGAIGYGYPAPMGYGYPVPMGYPQPIYAGSIYPANPYYRPGPQLFPTSTKPFWAP